MSRVVHRVLEGVWLLVGMFLGLLLLRAFVPGFAGEEQGGLSDPVQRAMIGDTLRSARQTAITRAVSQVEPAVVGINVTQMQRTIERSPYRRDPFWGQFFPDRIIERPVENLGSGFIISSDGLTLTNEHVVHNASQILVTLADGREVSAELVGADYNSDIALLDLEGEDYAHIDMGDSDAVLIGEWVMAIGNPYGLFAASKPSVTVGVISANDRDFGAQRDERVYKSMIQTDAAINPGNSGGPLVNVAGEAVAMNTMIYSQSGGSVGLGFAIPINRVRAVLGDLMTKGHVDRDIWTGIWIRDLSQRMAQALGYRGEGGVLVVELNPDSPAEEAGLQVNDVILSINGNKVSDSGAVTRIILEEDVKVGDRLILEVLREGRILTIAMTAGSRERRTH